LEALFQPGGNLPFFFEKKKTPSTEEDMEKLQTEQKLLDAELEVNLTGF